jgi:hypothetical protein
MSYSEIGLELVKVVITALLAAVLVHLLEHRRFIQGRWWDRKADAYGSIIDALVSMEHSLVHLLGFGSVVEETGEVPRGLEKHAAEWLREFDGAGDRVMRAAAGGDYVISRRASGALSGLMKKFPSYEDAWEFPWKGEAVDRFCALGVEIKSCLETVRAEARKDLRVRFYSL